MFANRGFQQGSGQMALPFGSQQPQHSPNLAELAEASWLSSMQHSLSMGHGLPPQGGGGQSPLTSLNVLDLQSLLTPEIRNSLRGGEAGFGASPQRMGGRAMPAPDGMMGRGGSSNIDVSILQQIINSSSHGQAAADVQTLQSRMFAAMQQQQQQQQQQQPAAPSGAAFFPSQPESGHRNLEALERENEMLRSRILGNTDAANMVTSMWQQMHAQDAHQALHHHSAPSAFAHIAHQHPTATLADRAGSQGSSESGGDHRSPGGDDKKISQSRYWSEEEHCRFLEAVKVYGAHNHKAIALMVGTRTSLQVRSHSQKFFKKLENHKGDGLPSMNRKRPQGSAPGGVGGKHAVHVVS